jgi:hypothetical protein
MPSFTCLCLDPDPKNLMTKNCKILQLKNHTLRLRYRIFFRVSDPDPYPDPHYFELQHPDPHSNCGSGSGSRRAKMTHKNRKKSRIFMFLSTGCSLLRAEGFSCSLGVLYGFFNFSSSNPGSGSGIRIRN